MADLMLARPGADEADALYQPYIARIPDERIGARLRGQLDELDGLIGPLDDAAALARYAPGKWSVKEVLGHLFDTERVYAYRMLRIARGDATPLPGFDENVYAAAGGFDRRTLASLRDEFRAVRLATIALAEGVPSEHWPRRGEANGRAFTARALVYVAAGHVAHHFSVLRERYGLGAARAAAQTS